MPTTALTPEVELFRQQAGMTRFTVGRNIAGLSHPDSLVRPEPAGNSLNWVLGHLLWVYQGTLRLLGQEPVASQDSLRQYARGAPPLADELQAVPFERLVADWDRTLDRVDAGLAEITPEGLERPCQVQPSDPPDATVRTQLATIMFHQAYHAGQTGLLRRVAGKDGAIK